MACIDMYTTKVLVKELTLHLRGLEWLYVVSRIYRLFDLLCLMFDVILKMKLDIELSVD
jgi:hypothetical protein